MTRSEKAKHEISEAFDFLRFLMKHPSEIKRIKNGSTVAIYDREFPATKKTGRSLPSRTNQALYLAERTFHRL